MTKIKFICPTCFFVNDLNSRECAQCETPLSHDHEKRYEKGDVVPQYEPDFYRDQGSFKPLKIEIRTSYCRNSKCLSIINEKEAYCKKCGSPIFHHYFSEKYIPKPQLFFQLPNFKMPIVFNIDGEFVFGRSKPNNNYEPMLHLTYVSRKHFVIHQHGKAFFIEDCS
jgi:predicted amidophosphoribosyltransferase